MSALLRSPNPQNPSANSASASKTLPPTDPPPIPIPPSPDPSPTFPLPHSTVSPLSPPANMKWTDLFALKPRNAGKFVPPPIKMQFSGNRLVPTEEILSASVKVWGNYLVGFFLDEALPFSVVYYQIKKHWNPKGAVKVKSNGTLFFFHFALEEDRTKVLEADPVIIHSKVFIVKEWDTSIGNNSARIRAVPVWLKLFDIPPLAWTQIGICWLATMVGKFLCMDENTEKLERLEYAKCMVEVNPDQILPDEFTVLLPDESEHVVRIEYLWKPAICSKCKVFGHNVDNCKLAPLKQDKEAHKITPEDTIKLPRNRVRFQDKRSNRLNVLKRKQAWKMKHTLNQEGKHDKSVVKVAAAPTMTDELVDSEDDMFNYTLQPIDLNDANLGPISVSYGIPIAKRFTENEHASEIGNGSQNGNNDMQIGKELEEGEISQQEEARDEFARQNSPKIHEKSVNRQTVEGNDGAKHAVVSKAFSACDKEDTRAVVNIQDKVVEEITSNKTGEAIHQIEIAEVDEMLHAAFPLNREVNDQQVMQIQQMQVMDKQCKGKENDTDALIRLIKSNMQEIEGKLQAELEKREVNTKQFYATKRTVKDFEDFKLRNAIDQMDNARLDGVAKLVKEMLESVNNKGKITPINKSKNPYAHLTAPLAYKERPPDTVTEPAPATSNEKPGSKTPITRSRKKEMLRNLQENG